MKNKINLNNEISIDIPKLIEGRMVILANSGGGKSYAIRKVAEEAVNQVQTIIIDPEGEFVSLREKYDFILAGKGADVPVEIRSAALLATKLLELGKSAVIDLYELHPQEKQRYVKLFCEALVNCPKELYHPVIIILDEAHEYVPEGKPSEATWDVEALASKGRKRGQCLIPASQRVSKLSKNVSAECNNKLIGRASQDIDMKRAGDELGFSKEHLVQLRQLKPGEFFAFGPAISDDIIKLKVGAVKTEHAKVAYKGSLKVPPPSSVIKKVLGELADLPQEVEKEATTVIDLKTRLAKAEKVAKELAKDNLNILNTQNTAPDPKIIQKLISDAVQGVDEKWDKFASDLYMTIYNNLTSALRSLEVIKKDWPKKAKVTYVYKEDYARIPNNPVFSKGALEKAEKLIKEQSPALGNRLTFAKKAEYTDADGNEIKEKQLGKCSRAIYSYLVDKIGVSRSKTQVGVATGYSQNSGGFNNSVSELSAAGLIKKENGQLFFPEGQKEDESLIVFIDTSLEKWLPKLGACSRKIWEFLLSQEHTLQFAKDYIAENTGYSASSGGYNNSISELSALGLIVRMQGGLIMINPEILNL